METLTSLFCSSAAFMEGNSFVAGVVAGMVSTGLCRLLWFLVVETCIRARSEYTGYWRNETLDGSGEADKIDYFKMRHDAKTGRIRGSIVRERPDSARGCRWRCTGVIVNCHLLFFFYSTGGLQSDGSGYGVLQGNQLHTFKGKYLSTSKQGKLIQVSARTSKICKGDQDYREARRMFSPVWAPCRVSGRLASAVCGRCRSLAKGLLRHESFRAKRATVEISFEVPREMAEAECRLRLVKYGKSEFNSPYDNAPLNKDYKPISHAVGRVTFRLRRVLVNRGFQFKCYAKCRSGNDARMVRDALIDMFDYAGTRYESDLNAGMRERLPTIAIGGLADDEVWFVLPGFRVYVTEADDPLHPYLNNFYDWDVASSTRALAKER